MNEVKITIDHKADVTAGGFLSSAKKIRKIRLTVEFSEVERHIIEEQADEFLIVLERRAPYSRYDSSNPDASADLPLSRLLVESDIYDVKTVREAKVYEQHLISALKDLKTWIDDCEHEPETPVILEL